MKRYLSRGMAGTHEVTQTKARSILMMLEHRRPVSAQHKEDILPESMFAKVRTVWKAKRRPPLSLHPCAKRAGFADGIVAGPQKCDGAPGYAHS